MDDNAKILKGIILGTILFIIFLIIIWYAWLIDYGAKSDLKKDYFSEDLKLELIEILELQYASTFEPVKLTLIDSYGPAYYNSYEIIFELSKGEYKLNNLSYGVDGDYDTLTAASKKEELNDSTYLCYKKYNIIYNREKFDKLGIVYEKLHGIYTGAKPSEKVVKDFNENSNNINETKKETLSPTTQDLSSKYNEAVLKLDSKYFVTDFGNYKQNSKSLDLSNNEIERIAEVGFQESAERIAAEGTENIASMVISEEEIVPNNYFTRKYSESDEAYPNLKMTGYVVSRENDLGCGVKIYIDPTTGLIVGGQAFGD